MDKVSLIKCEEYDYDKVKEALLRSVEHLGGLSKYISKGERVLLKVNLLMKKKPEEATTTHPVFVKALANILIEYGASVVIGDSPGGPFSEGMLRGIYKATGMEAAAQETGATLNANYKSCERENPDGLLLKRITVTDMLNDVDKVISVSKLKTHGMMTFTGAVKNMFGTVPGIKKAEYHLNMPEYKDFADAMLDICLCARPVLSFMDGIVGMEGHGPSGGNPRNVNVIIASNSPFQLDKAAVSIINLDFSHVPTIYRSIERGLCGGDLEDIEFFGDGLESFFIKDFDVPRTKMFAVPKFMKKFAASHVQPRPVFNNGLCNGCGSCAKNCPAEVIELHGEKPSVKLSGCIRCFCCQELCPNKAISIYRPFIVRKLM